MVGGAGVGGLLLRHRAGCFCRVRAIVILKVVG